MAKNRHILIIAAHPDDELLGCGGVARLHVEAGDRVEVVIACEGESVRYAEGTVSQRNYVKKAAEVIGFNKVHHLQFADQRLDSVPLIDIAKAVEHVVDAVRPSIVYTQFGGDVNQDHQRLFEAVNIATRPTREFIEIVYAFDTASSTEWGYPRIFQPDTFFDISSVLKTKLAALACYESEMREFPHPRSLQGVEAKARSWGVQACMEAAEVFMTIRAIRRYW